MIRQLYIPGDVFGSMKAHIQDCLPEEACGLLVGEGSSVTEAFPIENTLHSPVSFRMDPVEQYRVLLWQEQHEQDLLCIYHSHPAGPDHPSVRDMREFAYPGSPYIIWSLKNGQWVAFGFMIEGEKYGKITLHVVDKTT